MKNINKHANRDFINNEAVIIVKCSNKCNFLLELLAKKERGGQVKSFKKSDANASNAS